MGKITEQDTFDMFIGSGALSYSWWDDVESNGSPDVGWCVTAREFDETAPNGADGGPFITFDHASIMRTLVKLARAFLRSHDGTTMPAWAEFVSLETMRQACLFLADPDEADFDADTADQVMQVLAFGKVVY